MEGEGQHSVFSETGNPNRASREVEPREHGEHGERRILPPCSPWPRWSNNCLDKLRFLWKIQSPGETRGQESPTMAGESEEAKLVADDVRTLHRLGYVQELARCLGAFSNFA